MPKNSEVMINFQKTLAIIEEVWYNYIVIMNIMATLPLRRMGRIC